MGKARQQAQPKEEVQEQVAEVKEKSAKEVIYEVHAPNKSYSGLNCAVEFKNGVGVTKNEVIAEHFVKKGYEVKEI